MSKAVFRLFDKTSGQQIKVDDEVKDFREEVRTVTGIYVPGSSAGGRGGRVGLKDKKGLNTLFFPSVINSEFKLVEIPTDDGLVEDPMPGTRSYDRWMAKEKGYDE